MLDWLREFATVVAALIIVLDPFGLVPIVLGFSSNLGPRQTRRMIVKVSAGATLLLLLFTVAGTWLLGLFGVTIDDLRIGGGILLLIIALKMVVEGVITSDGEKQEQAAMVPLISPLLVGPGAISAAVVLAALHGVLMTVLAGIAAMLVCLVILLSTRLIDRLVGDSGAALLTRLMGVLMATIAVSYIRTGIIESIKLYRGL